MSQRRRRDGRTCRPGVHTLEPRRLPAQFGVPWHDAQHLTLSFVPDGTPVGTQRSVLFQTLGVHRTAADWQSEILRAFQIWSVDAHVNFGLKPDDGQPLGIPGPDQEDLRFGDIRIGAVPMSPDVLSISVPHDPFLSGTFSGDILLNSNVAFDREGDLLPVFLHEVGHVLGIDESSDPSSVMYASENNARDRLAPGDIAAVQSLYGARTSDTYEGPEGNDTLATATPFPAPTRYDGTTPLLIYANVSAPGDADVYSFEPPDGYQGPVTIRLQTAGVSLLAPRLTVEDAAGSVVGSLVSASDRGDTLSIVLPSVESGATYYVKVQGSRSDVFGIGEYALAANFDARTTIGAAQLDAVVRQTYNYLSPDDINAIFEDPQGALFHVDDHTDDTFATAAPLQAAGAYGTDAPMRTTASLSDRTDVDFYQFEAPDGGDSGTPETTDQPLVMTVTVRATEVNGLMPHATVFDEDQRPVPALVLAHGDGTYTIQVPDARPGSDYFVEVSADATSGKVVGNYDLDALFGHVVATPSTFVGSTLEGRNPGSSYELVVTQTQLFDFLLSTSSAAAPPTTALNLTIIDSAGRLVATRTAEVGDTAGGDPVLLAPGTYQARFTVVAPGQGPLPPVTFLLYGASLSDPIGPALDDPTGNPIASPTTAALAAGLPPMLGSSEQPYFWLAQSLSGPGGSDSPGESQAPVFAARSEVAAIPSAASSPLLLDGGPPMVVLSLRGGAPATVASPGPARNALAAAPRVMVTYTPRPTPSTASDTRLGLPPSHGPTGPMVELPATQAPEAGDTLVRTSASIPVTGQSAGSHASHASLQLDAVGSSCEDQEASPQHSAPPTGPAGRWVRSGVGVDVVPTAAILGMMVLFLQGTHPRTRRAGVPPARMGSFSHLLSSLTSGFRRSGR